MPNSKDYILYDSIYVKFKIGKISLERRKDQCLQREYSRLTIKKHEGLSGEYEDHLYSECDSYVYEWIGQNTLSGTFIL